MHRQTSSRTRKMVLRLRQNTVRKDQFWGDNLFILVSASTQKTGFHQQLLKLLNCFKFVSAIFCPVHKFVKAILHRVRKLPFGETIRNEHFWASLSYRCGPYFFFSAYSDSHSSLFYHARTKWQSSVTWKKKSGWEENLNFPTPQNDIYRSVNRPFSRLFPWRF